MAVAKGIAVKNAGAAAKKQQDVGQVSQWTLMRRRFMENKLSVFGGTVLIIMYLMAAVAPFLSPLPYDQIDTNYQFKAPTEIHFVNGWPSVCSVSQQLNQAT